MNILKDVRRLLALLKQCSGTLTPGVNIAVTCRKALVPLACTVGTGMP